jgi:hypothetical protein
MSLGILFWILMLLCLVFGWYSNYGAGPNWRYGPFGGMIIVLILLGILGWHDFGAPVH